VIALIVGLVLLAYPFWMRWSWMPKMRRRAVSQGRLGRWEPNARMIGWLSWVIFACGILAVTIGVTEVA
jgi:hypothetical protein